MRNWKLPLAAVTGAALLTVGALQAQDGPPSLPGQMDISNVEAGTYTTDASHALVGWRVNHFGFNDYFGIFGDIEGTLEIDPANLSAAKVDVMIPIAAVTTASAGLTEHMLRDGADGADADFFGANPDAAHFVSTSVRTTGATSAVITGSLTMNGQTHPVALLANFTGAGANPFSGATTIGFEGRAVITRSDWGLGGFTPLVGDEVELDITMAFTKG